LKSAKHHYGAAVSRGSRPYNEDAHQAGVIELPAFAKRKPRSLQLAKGTEGTSAEGASGDPQVFYFGVFDGHGGAECSDFLRENLHGYIERSATDFELNSSLHSGKSSGVEAGSSEYDTDIMRQGKEALQAIRTTKTGTGATDLPADEPLTMQTGNTPHIHSLEKDLVQRWKALVGGYMRRFKPGYFSIYDTSKAVGTTIEEVVAYAFLQADYDFVSAEANKDDQDSDVVRSERPLNDGDLLGAPSRMAPHVDHPKRFKGGSTCSIAMLSTPSPVPFWNPATTSTLLIAHVGDTRVLLSSTATGAAIPLTTNHHPSSPIEATRLRRYAGALVTDSFGEERISGLANTRAFGDIASKRIGVSAEAEIRRVELNPAEYAFMVLCSDGVSGTLSDQEIVDIVKEAKTAEAASRAVVDFATEVSSDGDNATCLVVRLGGWERRQEGGVGSLGTRESRDFKREAAADPRSSRR
jgi:protein phosphatase PTC6